VPKKSYGEDWLIVPASGMVKSISKFFGDRFLNVSSPDFDWSFSP
jgi:hypothetical protein